ncbi:MAG TPA: serine--tRNA ligase [Fimbriimonadales bacterium]|nr:serine--tRNA ligase [Fimbriimonadales bacterium]
MLDRHLIRSQPERVREGAKRKGIEIPLDEFLAVDAEWRNVRTKLNELEAQQNKISKSIGALIAQGKREEAEAAKRQAAQLKEEIATLSAKEKELEERLSRLELEFPNLPHESVPPGESAEDNIEVFSWGEKKSFSFPPRIHWDLGEELGLIDFARGSKISGSGFIVYKGLGAKLQRALINFMLDLHTQNHKYTEVYTPFLVTRETMTGTGQLPKFEEDLYLIERDDLFLIPTAEVPVTNLHRDEILEPEMLPIYYVAYSACFRREAGAAGKETRGLLRVHEFDKVELVKFCKPETSYDELETLRKDAEAVLQALGLHYRVMLLCAGELSFANAKCYDLEVWSPGLQSYLEVSSASNFESFQARRANIRYRPSKGAKPEFVHTLNASGVALPRLTAALLETYQNEDNSITVPQALRPYLGVEKITCS